jgi:hypothetical protein
MPSNVNEKPGGARRPDVTRAAHQTGQYQWRQRPEDAPVDTVE